MSKTISEDKILSNIGGRLKELRKLKGFTNYEHLAYEMGLSRSQYGRYEKGANMKLSTLIKILNFLDVSLEEFFKGIDGK